MIYSISTKKLIREMDSRELEDHLLKLWIEVDKNTGLLLLNHPDLKLIFDCYKQLTGKNIIFNITEEFSVEAEKVFSIFKN